MRNCFDCKIAKECDCGKMIIDIKEYLPHGIYNQIEEIIRMQFDCDDYNKI